MCPGSYEEHAALREFATVFLCPGIASVGSEEAARLGAAAAADLLEEDRTSLSHGLIRFEAWRFGSEARAAEAYFMRGTGLCPWPREA